MKLWSVKCAGHEARMVKRNIYIYILVYSYVYIAEKSKRNEPQGGWIILRWILEGLDGVVWAGFFWLGLRFSRGLSRTW
jgi:hypothetical protein